MDGRTGGQIDEGCSSDGPAEEVGARLKNRLGGFTARKVADSFRI